MGICINCNHISHCMWSSGSVVSCDEHYSSLSTEGVSSKVVSVPIQSANRFEDISGVCSNCNNQVNCSLNQKKKSLLYCEEHF